MKSLSIVDLNFFETEFPDFNVIGGIRIAPFDLIDDSSSDTRGPSGLSLGLSRSSGGGDNPSSNSSSASAVAYAPEGTTSTLTSTS